MGYYFYADKAQQTDPFFECSTYIRNIIFLDSLAKVIVDNKKSFLREIYPILDNTVLTSRNADKYSY